MSAPLIRLIVVLWALAVAAMPGTLAVADSRLEAQSLAAAPAHVEALGGTGCAAVHDAECAICSSLRLLTGAVEVPGGITVPSSTTAAVPCTGGLHAASLHGWLQRQPRAPPTA